MTGRGEPKRTTLWGVPLVFVQLSVARRHHGRMQIRHCDSLPIMEDISYPLRLVLGREEDPWWALGRPAGKHAQPRPPLAMAPEPTSLAGYS